MSERTQHVIVFESRSYWEPELQRPFLGEDVQIRACRAVSDLNQRLDDQSYDARLIDLSADATGLLRGLSDLQGRMVGQAPA